MATLDVIRICICGAQAVGLFYDGKVQQTQQLCALCIDRQEIDGRRLVTLYDWTPMGRYHELPHTRSIPGDGGWGKGYGLLASIAQSQVPKLW